MKLTEILLEYDANKTWQVYGEKLLAAATKDFSIQLQIRKADEAHLRAYILHCIKQADPTPNQQYSQWLAKAYSAGGIKMEDLMSNVKDNLELFGKLKLKRKLNPEDADIGRFATVRDFESMMLKYENVELESGKDKQKTALYNADVVFDDDQIRILKPKDVEAAMYYGRGTKWCTAAKNNNMYKSYAKMGDLYIIIPKNPEYKGEKYQFHFQEKQFMNELDKPIQLGMMLRKYPSVRTALEDMSDGNIHFIKDDQKRDDAYKELVSSLQDYGQMKYGVLWINSTNISHHEDVMDEFADLLEKLGYITGEDFIDDFPNLFVFDFDSGGSFMMEWHRSRDGYMCNIYTLLGEDLTPEQAAKLMSPDRQEKIQSIVAQLEENPDWEQAVVNLAGHSFDIPEEADY